MHYYVFSVLLCLLYHDAAETFLLGDVWHACVQWLKGLKVNAFDSRHAPQCKWLNLLLGWPIGYIHMYTAL